MYLLIHPNGSKYWRLDYRFAGTRKTLAIGVYPDISLSEAGKKCDAARKLLADSIDPSEHRKATKASRVTQNANSFEIVAREGCPIMTAFRGRLNTDLSPINSTAIK